MDILEPGDIIEGPDWNWVVRPALVIRSDPYLTVVAVRWLYNGMLGAPERVSCRILIKRYHIMLGKTYEQIYQELWMTHWAPSRKTIQKITGSDPLG